MRWTDCKCTKRNSPQLGANGEFLFLEGSPDPMVPHKVKGSPTKSCPMVSTRTTTGLVYQMIKAAVKLPHHFLFVNFYSGPVTPHVGDITVPPSLQSTISPSSLNFAPSTHLSPMIMPARQSLEGSSICLPMTYQSFFWILDLRLITDLAVVLLNF